jgi:high-affinity iron transporter
MLINSVILVLREVLEAAVLISVLLALTLSLRQSLRWLLLAVPLTVLAVLLFASFLDVMTDALDGAGQEVVSALLQLLVFVAIVGVVHVAARLLRGGVVMASPMAGLLVLATLCALTRECSEIVIYIAGFATSEEHRTAVFAGSAIGATIGVSAGVLLFAGLRALPAGRVVFFCYGLLALIGAGMVMQSSMLLEQVDWLPSAAHLWDSNALINEQSLTGQLLYAVFGYEATPSALQAWLYLVSLALVALAWWSGDPGRSADVTQ